MNDEHIIVLAVLLVAAVMVIDASLSFIKRQHRATGVGAQAKPVVMDGSKTLPSRTYVSEIQGLAGRPDAVISENGFLIPVEIKPLARKLRDRYVAQLLVYMRLIEEFEGKRPPYGYLILGENRRRIKISNTPERQAWLQQLIDQMQAILAGSPTLPTPHPRKCMRCDVRESCSFRADLPADAQVAQPAQAGRLPKRSGTS